MANGLKKSFTGWLIQFQKEMAPLLTNGLLHVHLNPDFGDLPVEKIQFGEYEAWLFYSWRQEPIELMHFIPTVSPIVKIATDRYKIFGGDLTDYLNKDHSANNPCLYENAIDEELIPSYFRNVSSWIT
mmetsp:Transcript_5084/g.3736  ORF Transcript_5084/g.3736 Transcript_5084/m.3736 type:complete len:128 (-) Transcript_5084:287-670(-)